MVIYTLIILSSIIFTSISLPFIKERAEKFNILDKPESRKQHTLAKVRLGGISFLLSFIVNIFFYSFLSNNNFVLHNFLIISLIFGFSLLGLLDDIFKISPWTRLIIQIILASFAWRNDIGIFSIDFSFFNSSNYFFSLPIFISYFLTIIWIVGITNAINWIDGLDGLAAGIVCISSIGMSFVSYKLGNFDEFIFLLIIIGICLAFLKYNFFPSKIIMGDGGSYFLGFSSSILFLNGSTRFIDNQIQYSSLIFVPLTLLAIPLIDMAYVIIIRFKNKKSPFYPDRNHIHHRIINSGISHRNTVLLIYFFTFITIFIAMNYVNSI